MRTRDPLAAAARCVVLRSGGRGHGVSTAMTVEERTPQVDACFPAEGLSRRPGPVERADPVGPNVAPPGSQDEVVSIRNMAAQLRAGYPSVDAITVEATVRTAYDSFHEARVRIASQSWSNAGPRGRKCRLPQRSRSGHRRQGGARDAPCLPRKG
ncbi:three-helix bundle dimerization domain-containing protein [Streptomyces sp. NPDC059349]|uniref:three-helix bundle dimerization domain-containing protein n=1 Tax=Streptomyces sp. NPDC059349 TaxID=3346808 RepID=UPI0036CB496A